MRPLLASIILGRVLAPACNRDAKDWPDIPPDLISPAQAALCLPIGLRDQRGALVLVQSAGKGGFNRNHIAFARQCAVVSLAGLAVRSGSRLETEVQRLNLLVER